MSDGILGHEPALRLGAFLAVLASMTVWELAAARRRRLQSRPRRWLANLGILAVDTVVLRLLFPAAAVGMALVAERGRWGLFNAVDLPRWLEVVLAVVVLDLVIYLQHVMFHAVPALWRLHMVHHSDRDFDVTTGVRFHPVEIVLSMVIKLAAVAALGAPALAVLIFEVLLNATSMFNHGNVRLSAVLDRWLRWLVVTPEMHRVHHSVVVGETNSNFGFNLPWWDRLLGTYRAQPAAGHEEMTIGISQVQEPEPKSLLGLLVMPIKVPAGSQPIPSRNADE
jgi:sterol desaturase/sphingolipid hydroxylase (fatty acid hydroxylase superfamily)